MLNLTFDDVIEEEKPKALPAVTEEKRWLGIYDDLPDQEYRDAPGANKSGLDDIHRSPLHYITKKRNPMPPTPAMFVGRAFHSLVLEPDKFDQEFMKDPGFNKRTKAGREEYEQFMEENAGITLISTNSDPDKGIWGASDWDMIHRMRDSVMAHPIASILLQGIPERSIWWVDPTTGKLCKGRVDVYNDAHSINVDLKSTADASYSGFAHSIHKFRYFVQDAFYTDGTRAVGEKADQFIFVCVEKEPPYAVACYALEKEWVRIGREVYQRDLEVYKQCHESGEWPCYHVGARDQVIPGYAKFHPIS